MCVCVIPSTYTSLSGLICELLVMLMFKLQFKFIFYISVLQNPLKVKGKIYD